MLKYLSNAVSHTACYIISKQGENAQCLSSLQVQAHTDLHSYLLSQLAEPVPSLIMADGINLGIFMSSVFAGIVIHLWLLGIFKVHFPI